MVATCHLRSLNRLRGATKGVRLKMPRTRISTVAHLVAGMISLTSSSTHAQTSIGLMVGPTAAGMSGSYIEGTDGVELGIGATLVLDHQFGDRWALVTGVGWVQKGGKSVTLSSASDSAYGFQSSYLQVPLLARAALPISGGPWSIAPFVGVAIGLNVGCKHKSADQFEFEEEGCDENSPGGEPRTLEFSAPFGVNVWREFPGGSRIVLEARYEPGLTNTFEAASDDGKSARNNIFAARFGFLLPLN